MFHFSGILCILLTQLDKCIPYLIALLIIGSALVSIDVFPKQWNNLDSHSYVRHLKRIVKGSALSLIVFAFWIRLYQNLSELEDIFAGNIVSNLEKDNMTRVVEKWISESNNISGNGVAFKEAIFGQFDDNCFDKLFEIVLNLMLVSILPLVAVWTAYKRDNNLLNPTDELRSQPIATQQICLP